jgi:hypothetical protein
MKLLPFFGVLLIQISVLTFAHTSTASFEPVTPIRRELISNQEIQLPKLDQINITYKAYREYIEDRDNPKIESEYPVIAIELNELNENQFNALKSAFGGTSKIKYSSSEKYSLTDFLPPLIQALDHHYYSGNAAPNCAGTVFNLVNPRSETFYAFTPYQVLADAFLADSAFTFYVPLSELEQTKMKVRSDLMTSLSRYRTSEEGQKRIIEFYQHHHDPGSTSCGREIGQIAPVELESQIEQYQGLLRSGYDPRTLGDVLLISEKDYFIGIDEHSMRANFTSTGGSVHVAIAIDGNLFFEKPDPNLNSPFRLRLLQDIENSEYFPRSNPEVVYQFYKIKKDIEDQTIQILETLKPGNLPFFGSREKNFSLPRGSKSENDRLQSHSISFDSMGRASF